MAGIVALAFAVGIGAGWLTTTLPRFVADHRPGPSPSQSPELTESTGPVVPVDLYPPLERTLDTDDIFAGLSGLDVPTSGDGKLTVARGQDDPGGDGPKRWVRIEVEDGLPLTPDALAIYVMGVLNDPRGWGADGRVTFARTDGVADIRIIFASPTTAGTLCPEPHDPYVPVIGPPDVTVSPSPSVSVGSVPEPSPTVSPTPVVTPVPSCAQQGILVVNAYRWAAGVASYGDDRIGARAYLINHFMGHILGESDTTCTVSGQQANVMVDQEFAIEPCVPGAWPNPAITSG